MNRSRFSEKTEVCQPMHRSSFSPEVLPRPEPDYPADYMPQKGDTVLVQELASGSTEVAAANKAGVHVDTATGRLRDPGFRKLLTGQRADLLSEVAGVLASAATGAALALVDLYSNEGEPAHVRRSAARDVLEFSIRVRELHAMEERITMVEELLEKEAEL